MLRNSFSSENLIKIFYNENRKGNFVEGKYFPSLNTYTRKITDINSEIKDWRKRYESGLISKESFYEFKDKKYLDKVEVLKEKQSKIRELIQEVIENISKDDFELEVLNNFDIAGKPIYTLRNNAENFLTLKQLQQNLRNSFKIQQSNRFEIVNQLANILADNFPKYIIRTDLQEFYESIPIERLKKKINNNSLLGFSTKKHLWKIISDYKTLSGNDNGIPRGIGVSAFLSELYMKDIDNSIRSLNGVTYYARYVDDIIIIFTPESLLETNDYFDKIKKIVETDNGLSLHPVGSGKTNLYDIISSPSGTVTYLGYSFRLSTNSVKIKLSNNKKNKYKSRIDSMLQSYNTESKYDEKQARSILIKRLKFLTGNTRLLNVKKNVLVGVYFSNSLLNTYEDFSGLDNYLNHKLNSSLSPYNKLPVNLPRLKNRLAKYKFVEGFKEKRFHRFSKSELEEIMKIWK